MARAGFVFQFLKPCAVAAFLALVAACGGGGGGGEAPVAHAPSISNLRYSPATAVQVPGGTATVSGTVDFSDAGADIAAFRMTSSGGADLTVTTPQLNGLRSGTVTAAFVVSVEKVGKYAFEIWAVDSQGSASNRLSGTFEVTDHPPTIANLRYAPTSAVQLANGTATIDATIDFTDAGGDIAALRMVSSGGADLTVPTPGLAGVKSGVATGGFVVSLSQVGNYTFELWAVDSQGKESNRLSGAFAVVPPTPADHPPTIANLRYSPASVYRVPNGTVAIFGTIDFSDAGGDITSLRMVSSGGADLTVPTPGLSGITSGTGSGAFNVSIDQVGKYTFEVWMTDSKGSSSNRLSGTFEVLLDDTATTFTKLFVTPPSVLLGIDRSGGQYVAVGANGTVMTTRDLANWTVQTSGVGHRLNSVAGSGSRFVAIGDNSSGEGVVITSTDGASWTVSYTTGACQGTVCSAPSMLSKVIWTGTRFVAVGQERISPSEGSPGVYALILTSPDGLTWTQQAARTILLGQPSVGPESGMKSVAWSGGLLVTVGMGPDDYPAAWTSADAETWTRRTVPGYFGQNLRDVTWGLGKFVAVGWGGTPAVFSSSDGIIWQANSGGAPLSAMNAVTTGATRYLAVANTLRETSVDGLAWTQVPSTDCGNDVLWDGARYVSVGASICRSP